MFKEGILSGTYRTFATTVSQHCHNTVTTLSQQCHNTVTTLSQQCHNTVTTVSQLKLCDFSGETFKGFEVL